MGGREVGADKITIRSKKSCRGQPTRLLWNVNSHLNKGASSIYIEVCENRYV